MAPRKNKARSSVSSSAAKKKTKTNANKATSTKKRVSKSTSTAAAASSKRRAKERTSKPASAAETCGVCLEPFKKRGKINSCNHMFCYKCIKKWMSSSNSCPLCKKRVTSLTAVSVATGKAGKKEKIHNKDFGQTLQQDRIEQVIFGLQRAYRSQNNHSTPSHHDARRLIVDMMLSAFARGRGLRAPHDVHDEPPEVRSRQDVWGFDDGGNRHVVSIMLSNPSAADIAVNTRGGGTSSDPITFLEDSDDGAGG